jgi:hypothetical protein
MATISRVRLEEYLDLSFRPDREYVDGEIRERNVGKWEHACQGSGAIGRVVREP